MGSFLQKKKTKKTYEEKISTEPKPTQRCKLYAVKNFRQFVADNYDGRTDDNVIEELMIIRKKEGEQQFEDSLYGLLQDWINWNEKTGKKSRTIIVTFSNLRQYLFFRGIKTHEQDIHAYLRFSKIPNEEKYPLSLKELRAIVDGFSRNPLHQAITLGLCSSGMRIGEIMKIKKKD